VKVRIAESKVKKALPILNKILGNVETIARQNENMILVPVDFSGFSIKAGIAAFDIAHKLNSKLVLFHVIPQPEYYTLPYTDFISYDSGLFVQSENREKESQEKYKVFIDKLITEIGQEKWKEVNMEFIMRMGHEEDDILDYAEEHPPRLIVMASKGRHTIHDDLMGTLTADIISRAKVPVLAIPEKMKRFRFDSLKKVVYATNFDEKDFVAVDKLMSLLRPFQAKVYCLHVGQNDEITWDIAKLEGMREVLKKRHVHTELECVYLQGKDLLRKLDTYIKKHGVDILSLTTHKRNMITRIFNPSIAKEMLFHTEIPLLVFHA
jgi:nucleotide-binding universal stress UspA family protein